MALSDLTPESLSRAHYDAILTRMQEQGWFARDEPSRQRAVRALLAAARSPMEHGDVEEALYRVNRLAEVTSIPARDLMIALSKRTPEDAAVLNSAVGRAVARHLEPDLWDQALLDVRGAWVDRTRAEAHLFFRTGHVLARMANSMDLIQDLELSLSCAVGTPLTLYIHAAD